MNPLDMLYTIFIMPLKLLLEVSFSLIYKVTASEGLTIIALALIFSVAIMLICREAYRASVNIGGRISDKTETAAARILRRGLGNQPWILSLALELLFLIASYQYIAHLQIIHGVAFHSISDLGDGGVGPFCSALIMYYCIHLVIAVIMLLLFRWKYTSQVLKYVAAVAGLIIIVYGAFIYQTDHIRRRLLLVMVGLVCLIPIIVMLTKKLPHRAGALASKLYVQSNYRIFLGASLYISALIGLWIPSAVINSSAQEFVSLTNYMNPNWYVVNALCLSLGYFLVWLGVIYLGMTDKGRGILELLLLLLAGIATVDYFFFGKGLGILNSNLKYLDEMEFSGREQIFNILAIVLVAAVLLSLYFFLRKSVATILIIAALSVTGMSIVNCVMINVQIAPLKASAIEEASKVPEFSLSTEGQNVVVIMLDRGMNEYIPYIMAEKPELQEQFAGFTYYDNVTSFGGHTNIGSPALYGGYEYTPEEMNKRTDESLASKHNEALMLMPVVFDQAGYDVTVCDQSYANYSYVCDQSIYDDYEDINTYITSGYYEDETRTEAALKSKERNFFCFSFMKAMPLCIEKPLYDKGSYNETTTTEASVNQKVSADFMIGDAEESAFLNAYSVLDHMADMTQVSDSDTGSLLVMANDTAHEVMLLQEPDYVPAEHVDNTEYEAANQDRYTVDGVTLNMNSKDDYTFYQSNMAAMIQLGEWFDYLREMGVYDNTRIILVSDHGAPTYQLDSRIMEGGEQYDGDDTTIKDETEHFDTEYYYPLLMVKDFGATEYTVSHEFMTNADVPTLAFSDLIDNPVNPFTGKAVTNDDKYAHDQHILASGVWDINRNNGNTFIEGQWLSVHDDVRDISNWSRTEDPNK